MCNINLLAKTINGDIELTPNHISSNSIVWKKQYSGFYRKSIEGSFILSQEDLTKTYSEIKKCCNNIPIDIKLNGKSLIKFNMMNQGFSENLVKNQFYSKTNLTIDYYDTILKKWNYKVNMLSMPRSRTVNHRYRRVQTDNGNDTFFYENVDNPHGIRFADYVYFCVKKTLEYCNLQELIPSDSNSLSLLFSLDTCPINKDRNKLKFATIVQSSEFVRPLAAPGNGLNEIGNEINESLSISMKDLMNNIEILFNLVWFIDEETKKLRIEHISYLAFGKSYDFSTKKIGIDLRKPKYSSFVENFDYSTSIDNSSSYGIQRLVITQNKSINEDSSAYPISFYTNNGDYFSPEYGGWKEDTKSFTIPKLVDFEYGNVEYSTECSLIDEEGKVIEETKSSDLFCTHYVGAYLYPNSFDMNKWVLLDTKLENNKWVIIKGVPKISNTLLNVDNIGFSASQIFNDYHKHNRPFKYGVYNYNEKSIEKKVGILSSINTIPRLKLDTNIVIPYEIDFEPFGINYLPDGRMFIIDETRYNFDSNTISISAHCYDNCNNQFSNNDSNCLPLNTIISSQQIPSFIFNGTEIIVSVINMNIYADGNCGFIIKYE